MAKELNVFVENRPGRLRSVAAALAESKINVRTMTLQDRGEYGLMKLIVDNPEAAHLALVDKGFACALKEILAVSLKDKPGSFMKLADAFLKHEVNILDAYGFVIESKKEAVFCVEVKNAAETKKALITEGFRVLEEELYDF
ncbi:MAG: ACT domain-containing protein [Candidatus Omnitrophica bacterium]|nr:ACT domain-containing protein [Candidatus Omnitrophota bacterium]